MHVGAYPARPTRSARCPSVHHQSDAGPVCTDAHRQAGGLSGRYARTRIAGGEALPASRLTIPAVPLLPILLVIHIALAIALFLPSLLLPFALRSRPAGTGADSPVARGLLALQAHGTVVIGAGLAVTGTALIALLGPALLGQPWLLVALTIYAANLVIAFFVQRPGLRRLIGVRAALDDRAWPALARRQRYLSYLMAGLVGTIGLLMSQKPQLW